MADKTFVMRLQLENGEVVVRGLDEIGDKGEGAARRIKQAAANDASPGLRAFSAATNEASQKVQEFARQAGPLGNVLTAIGPGGLLAAAGIGAIGLAAVALVRQTRQAITELDDIGDAAARLGVGVETMVAWGNALEIAGGQQADLASGFETFQTKVGAFMAGVGKEGGGVGKALAAIGISKEQLQDAGTLEQRLLLISEALSKVGDRAARAGLADKLGLSALFPLLERGAAGVQELVAQFEDQARVTAEAAGSAGTLADQLFIAEGKIKAAGQAILINLGPALASFMTYVAENLPGAIEQFRQLAEAVGLVERTQFRSLENQAKAWGEIWLEAKTSTLGFADWFGGNNVAPGLYSAETALARLQAVLKQMNDLAPDGRDPELSPRGGVPPPIVSPTEFGLTGDVPAALTAEAKAALKAAEAYAELARARAGWRDDPAVFGESRNAMEDISSAVSAEVKAQTDALDKTFQEGFALRESFRPTFTNAFVQLANGDARGALDSLADHFTQRLYSGLANALFDNLFPSTGGTGTDFFGSILSSLGIGGGASGGTGFKFVDSILSSAGTIFGGARAGGGPVMPGSTYLVGEYGPEVLRMGQMGGQVFNPSQILSAGGGQRASSQTILQVEHKVINNMAGAQVETRETRDASGKVTLEAIIEPIVRQAQAKNVRSGAMDKPMAERTGVMPRQRLV